MKERFPSYYPAFRCLAGDCPHTCCAAGWEIPVDEKTARRYESLVGELGQQMKTVLRREGDGEPCLDLKGRVCPFLNAEGLCRLWQELGETGISEICRSHPRYRYEFGSWREMGLCGSCPQAVRLILETEPLWTVKETPEESGAVPALLTPLLSARETALEILTARELPLFQRMQAMLLFANEVQVLLDEDTLEALPRLQEVYGEALPLIGKEDLPDFAESLELCLAKLTAFQHLCPRWGKLLNEGQKALKNGPLSLPEEAGERVCAYFLSRHWLRGVWDGDVLSWAQFAILGTVVSALLAPLEKEGFGETFRLFCEEMEHSEDNMAAAQDAFCEALSLARMLAVAGGGQ